ncbi:hypothetical protein ABZ249_24100 [Nocardiopsis sp. NPDC006139]|uniref:hypothetical protein n=1 Tax=Nocardiopsis TaxID=2013 RepID=UPI0033AD5754
MLRTLGTAGDRLLARLVPRATASASYCWWQYAPISSPCIRRSCCNVPGSGGTNGATVCSPYRPC